MNTVFVLSLVLVVGAFLGCAGFAVVYQLRSRWWTTDVGRNQMAFAASEGAVLGLSLLEAFTGPFPGMVAVNMLAFAVFTYVAWWRLTVLVKSQRHTPTLSSGGFMPPIPSEPPPSEPALTVGTITAAVTAVLALIVAFGLNLTAGQSAAILGVVAVIAPLVSAYVTRGKVYSPASVFRMMNRTPQ